MPNEENLIPIEYLSKEEAKKRGSAGGKASGAARRRKKSMREKMKLLLSLPACDNDVEQLQALGVEIEDADNEMVILKGLFLKAATGDVSAVKEIRNIIGKDISTEELLLKKKELKLKEQSKETSTEVLEKLDEVLGGIKSEF